MAAVVVMVAAVAVVDVAGLNAMVDPEGSPAAVNAAAVVSALVATIDNAKLAADPGATVCVAGLTESEPVVFVVDDTTTSVNDTVLTPENTVTVVVEVAAPEASNVRTEVEPATGFGENT